MGVGLGVFFGFVFWVFADFDVDFVICGVFGYLVILVFLCYFDWFVVLVYFVFDCVCLWYCSFEVRLRLVWL